MKLNPIDLRKELSILRKYIGHRWVAHRSIDLSKPCTECNRINNEIHNQPQKTCKTCYGIGYAYIDKIVKGFRYLSTPGVDLRSSVGSINTRTEVYILEHDCYPKPVDWILELQLNESTMVPVQPFKVTTMFKVQDCMALRGDSSRIEFWRCSVEERNLDSGRATL